MPHFRKAFFTGARIALALTLCAVFAPISGAFAQSAETYAVRNIQIDISADNVTVAREKALLEAQRQAYVQVMQRLTAPADWSRLPKLSDPDLQDMVLDVGIDQEKRSNVRYLATLSVRFKVDQVRKALRSAGIPYAEWRGRPVVVVAVWQSDAGPLLFEANNLWRDAWKSGAAQGVVPLAALTQPDPSLDAKTLASASPDALSALAQRFAPQDVILAVATPQQQEGGKAKIDVALYGQGPVGGLANGQRSYQGDNGEQLDAIARRAVEDIAKTVSDGWKSNNVLQFDRQSTLQITAPLPGGLTDWTLLRDKLVRSTPVRSFEVVSISRTEAHLVLHYAGEQPQLESIFQQNGLVLTWADDHWILQNTSNRN